MDSSRKTTLAASIGLIAAGAGIAAYFILKPKKDNNSAPKSNDTKTRSSVPEEAVKATNPVNNTEQTPPKNDKPVVTKNIQKLQTEVDACSSDISYINKEATVEQKTAAAALIGQKLNSNVNFQKFTQGNQSTGLDVSQEVVFKDLLTDDAEDLPVRTAKLVQSSEDEVEEEITESFADSKQSSFVTDFGSLTGGKDDLETAEAETEASSKSTEKSKWPSSSPVKEKSPAVQPIKEKSASPEPQPIPATKVNDSLKEKSPSPAPVKVEKSPEPVKEKSKSPEPVKEKSKSPPARPKNPPKVVASSSEESETEETTEDTSENESKTEDTSEDIDKSGDKTKSGSEKDSSESSSSEEADTVDENTDDEK